MTKIYTMYRDPIGPGTKAWTAFDRALDTYMKEGRTKRFYNQRDYMRRELRANGEARKAIIQWCEDLLARCEAGDN